MTKKVTKKSAKQKNGNFFASVRKEMQQVSWPTKKNVFKYTVTTVIFMLFITGFFLLINLLMSVVKGWFI